MLSKPSFSVAYDKVKADDPINYFTAKENQDLGLVKALRKAASKVDLSPFPAPLDKIAITLTSHECSPTMPYRHKLRPHRLDLTGLFFCG